MPEPKSAFSVYATKKSKILKRKKNKSERMDKSQKKKLKLDATLSPTIMSIISSPTANPSKPKKQKKSKKKEKEVIPQLVTIHQKPQQVEQELHPYILKQWQSSDSIANAVSLLKWMMHPVAPGEFFDTYWETGTLHIDHRDTNYFRDILSTADLDKMFREHPLFFGRNVDIVKYEGDKRVTNNPAGRAKASLVWDAYSSGHSIRILNPQSYNKTVQSILSTLQEYFGTMVGCNAYLTPAGSQGFAPHYDDIEAFVIQLEGRKHWKLYDSKNGSDTLARTSSVDFKRGDVGNLAATITLSAGDFLYFPRGVVHEACTDEEMHSLHLTISTYQKTSYADLLEHVLPEALKMAAHNDVSFRKGLPVGYLKHLGAMNSDIKSNERRKMLNQVERLIGKLVDYVPAVDHAADQLGRKFMHEAVPPVLTAWEQQCSSQLDGCTIENGNLQNWSEIEPDTEIRLLRSYAVHLAVEAEEATLYYCTENSKVYHGEEEQYITVSLDLCPLVEVLLHKYPEFVTVESLPHEDMSAKICFITELWDYGLIVTREALPVEEGPDSVVDHE